VEHWPEHPEGTRRGEKVSTTRGVNGQAALSEQAAALVSSLLRSPPFVDGNERVTFTACAVLLRMNGF